MNKILLDYRTKADDLFEEVGRFACFVRDIQFQKDCIVRLSSFKKLLTKERKNSVKEQDNDLANGFASFELVTESLICELKMWISLKESKFNDAWDFLIDSQDSAIRAMQAHEVNAHLNGYIRRLEVLEKILFPPQFFVSDRSIVSKCMCSICNNDIQDCEHIKGKFYMGEQCYEIVTKIESIKGFDFVKEPASKKCRMMIRNEGDVEIDLMTLLPITK